MIFILDSHYYRSRSVPERSSTALDTPRKMSTQLESVHSSSDREHPSVPQKVELQPQEEPLDLQERIYNILKKWFDVWKGMFLYGDVSQCTIYFPLVSLSAVGSQGKCRLLNSLILSIFAIVFNILQEFKKL